MATNLKPGMTVRGKVSYKKNIPLSGVVVRAFDRDMRNEELLGEATTDRQGAYEISYTRDKFARAEKNSADLLMKVFATGGKNPLYSTDMDNIRFNASAYEEINILIEQDIPASINEFDLIIREITPLIEKTAIADLQENDKNRDLSFLTKETGVPQDKLEHLVVAYRLANESKTDASFFYALLRKNTLLKTDISKIFEIRLSIGESTEILPLLYQTAMTDPKLIRQDVEAAVKEMIVPDTALKVADKAIKTLGSYQGKAQTYFKEERPKKMISLVSQFVLAGKISDIQDEYVRSGSDLSLFFKNIFSDKFFKTNEKSDAAKASVALGEILGYNSTLISDVRKTKGIKKPEDIKKLAAMNKADWKKELTASAAKIKNSGQPPDKNLIDYHASLLARNLEKQFPSVAYQAQLNRGDTPLPGNEEVIKDFLNKHEDFELHKTNIDLFLKKNKISGKKSETIRTELKKIQRILKLAPKYSQTNALLKKNIHSAQHIVSLGKGRFVNEIAPKAGLTKEEATLVFAKAEKMQTAAMLVAGDLQSTLHAVSVPALTMQPLALKLEKVSKDFPSMKTLFQLTDNCACEHCRSVYSPAAYLAEGIHWVSQRSVTDTTVTPHTTSNLAKDLLFTRRPDLGDIDLGCENAETPVPYIDLVCEILEEAISPDPGIAFSGDILADPTKNTGKISPALLAALQAVNLPVTDKALIFETESTGSTATLPHYLRDTKLVCKIISTGVKNWTITQLRQTLLSAEELAAAPQYVNEAAYTALNLPANAFAFKLPFDLHEAEAHAYFDRFNISRAELMQEFQLAGVPSDDSIAAEKAGISDSERKIIITADPGNQQIYWCTGALTAVNAMKVVDTFLTKTALTYEELDTLLALKYIDPANNLFIKHLDTDLGSCDTTKQEIANLDDNALDRMHRFLRLQKKSGWTISTVDEVISQPKLGNGNPDNTCLHAAAVLMKIQAKTGLTPEELICFYGRLPHQELPHISWTLYDKVFQNKAKNGSLEPGLSAANVTINETALVKKQLADYKTAIAVCLQIKEQDFDSLTGVFANKDLTFQNLSTLYGISRLLRKLKLKADDYLILTELTGLDPFNSPDDTLEFAEAVTDAKNFPLKPADIRFMLRHEAANLPDREIKDSTIEALLKSLQASYQISYLKNRSPYDDSLGADEQKEAAGNLLSTINLLSADDVKIILKFADQNWVYSWTDDQFTPHTGTVPADAITFINDKKLSTLFDTTSIKATLAALGTAVSPNIENARKALLKAIMDTVSAYRLKSDKQSILSSSIATTFKTDADLALIVLQNSLLKQTAPGTDILFDLLTTDALIDTNPAHALPVLPAINAASFTKQYQGLRLLHKLLPLISSFKFDNSQAEWFLQKSAPLGWFEADKIPFQAAQIPVPYNLYSDFCGMLQLIRNWTPVENPADAGNQLSFLSLLDMLLNPSTTRSQWITALSLLSGYEQDDIDAIDNYFGFSVLPDPADLSSYKKADTWDTLVKCADFMRKLGVSIDQIKAFIKPVLTVADTDLLKNALKALYDESTWLDTLRQITDSIRPQKRDALVAYLLAVNPDLEDARDLYDFYLVDTQMESCMPSSRIVLAHGTLQLFVERCLMGAEPKATADTTTDTAWDQWKWMKNYRVWEANRKVFLYPENYIEAELLDDKSFLFDELINESRQNELTEDSSKDLVIRYVEKLDDISFLEVVASWYQTDILTMHVFARTKGGDPHIYYYRRFEKERYWTPWEKVDVDITSDLLVAFVRNNRLNLAWGVFSEEPKPTQTSSIPSTTAGTPVDNQKPSKKLKIQLAVSEYANGQWKPKKISADAMSTPQDYTDADIPRNQYNLMFMEITDQIWIFSSTLDGTQEYNQINGIFDIAGCKGYPELVFGGSRNFNDFLPDFRDSQLNLQRYNEMNRDKTDDLATRNAFSPFTFYQILQRTPGKSPNIPSASFRLTYPLQLTKIDLIALLFEYLLLLGWEKGNGANS